MNKLGQNKFLTFMGVLFLIAAVAWGVLVLPAGSAANAQVSKINTAVSRVRNELAELPGEQNAKLWTEHADKLKTRYSASLRKQLERDETLGHWFGGIDNDSTFAAFLTPYDDNRDALEKELLDKGVMLGAPVDRDGKAVETRSPGFNWILRSDIARADTHEKEMQAKEILQKRYNICRYVANAVMADVEKGYRARRLLDVTFLEKFPFLQSSLVGAEQGRTYLIPVDPKRYIGYVGMGSGSYHELMLPSNGDEPLPETDAAKTSDAPPAPPKPKVHLGKTLTFGFAVVMDYHHVHNLIRNLIEPPGGGELNLSIIGLNIFVNDPNPPEKVEVFNLPTGGDPNPILEKAKEDTANCPPPQVHVYVTCQVFDLDPAAVPAFLK